MDFQSLEVLEQKIKRLVSSLQALQTENEKLTQKCSEGEKIIRKLQQDLDRWSASAHENESLRDEIKNFKRERQEIKDKIETLISQIDQLEAKI
jgi:predicted RNase H-like nuclease (RuvC/YqgF family)